MVVELLELACAMWPKVSSTYLRHIVSVSFANESALLSNLSMYKFATIGDQATKPILAVCARAVREDLNCVSQVEGFQIRWNPEKRADDQDTRIEEGVVYKVPCRNCEASYISETGRSLQKRIMEHKYAGSQDQRQEEWHYSACMRHETQT